MKKALPKSLSSEELEQVIKKNYLIIDDRKHCKFNGVHKKKLIPVQNITINKLANFSTQIYNLAIL